MFLLATHGLCIGYNSWPQREHPFFWREHQGPPGGLYIEDDAWNKADWEWKEWKTVRKEIDAQTQARTCSLIFMFLYVCTVYAHVCMCLCVHACVYVCVCVRACRGTWRPEVYTVYLLQILSVTYPEVGSLSKPGAHEFYWTVWPVSSRDPMVCALPVLG